LDSVFPDSRLPVFRVLLKAIPRRLLVGSAVVALAATACSTAMFGDPSGITGAELGAPQLEITVLAGDDLTVVPAAVDVDGVPVTLDAVGTVTVAWPERPMTIQVDAPGFHTWTEELAEYPQAGTIEFRLDPVVLIGRITTPDGVALPGVEVTLGEAVPDVTDEDGRFRIERAVPGEARMVRPAWQERTYSWDGAIDKADLTMEPLQVRALRAGADAIGDQARWREVLSLADVTGVDGLVIDVKDETGTVLHDTEVTEAHEIGAVKAFYDLDDVVAEMDARDLYGIARIVAFQDTPLATADPDHAVTSDAGGLWETNAGHNWLDPSDPAAYEYAVDLGEEACRRGFDEIQFDYVSYPFGGNVSTAVFDGAYTEEVRVASIIAFLDRAYTVLSPLGCAVSANVLAITLESPTDEGVGQRPGAMSRTIDVLNPMIYTTNYGPGWKGIEDPDAFPIEIVDGALANGVRKLEGFGYYRPWLQTWTISSADVRAVQRAAEARDLGWLLWSSATSYSADYLPPR